MYSYGTENMYAMLWIIASVADVHIYN